MENNLGKKKEFNYRLIGIVFVVSAVLTLIASNLAGISAISTNAILGLYYSGHISASSAEVSLAGIGIPESLITAWLFSTAYYEAFIDGALVVVIRYSILDTLGFWGWIILAGMISAIA